VPVSQPTGALGPRFDVGPVPHERTSWSPAEAREGAVRRERAPGDNRSGGLAQGRDDRGFAGSVIPVSVLGLSAPVRVYGLSREASEQRGDQCAAATFEGFT
jgi:hypothetical protein